MSYDPLEILDRKRYTMNFACSFCIDDAYDVQE